MSTSCTVDSRLHPKKLKAEYHPWSVPPGKFCTVLLGASGPVQSYCGTKILLPYPELVYEYSKLDLDDTHCPNTVLCAKRSQITTYGRSYRHSTKCEITDRSSLGPRICRPDLNWAPSWLLAHSSSPTNGINDHLTASFSRLVRRRYVRLLVRDLLLTNSVPILQAMPPRFWHLVPSTVSRHRCEVQEQ